MGGGQSKLQDEGLSASSVITNDNSRATSTATQQQQFAQTTDVESSVAEEFESKCPMHKKDGSGGYSYDWTQLFRAAAAHGPKGTKPLPEEEQEKARAAMNLGKAAATSTADDGGGGGGGGGGGCPVKHNAAGAPKYPEYNVRGEPIDKTNQMPKGIRTQMPASTQTKELSTDRVKSSIPKGGGDNDASTASATATTWTYPSPQQFYNALARKGKLEDDTTEEDMASVVALHNNMNEKTWAKVVEWERQTYKGDATPKLLKFMGRPQDLSPKARLKHWMLGHPLPYDRHDWTVLRDDGTTVRYIIDYYYDETRAQTTEESGMPHLYDRDATPSLLVDVRPALDGPSQLAARAVQMPYAIWSKTSDYQPLPLRGTPEMAQQVQESVKVWKAMQEQSRQQQQQQQEAATSASATMDISEEQATAIALNFAKAMKECTKARQRVGKCESEYSCSLASMDLTMCMGQRLCTIQHKNLVEMLGSSSDAEDGKIEAALETLTECVMLKTAERRLAREQHPSVFGGSTS